MSELNLSTINCAEINKLMLSANGTLNSESLNLNATSAVLVEVAEHQTSNTLIFACLIEHENFTVTILVKNHTAPKL